MEEDYNLEPFDQWGEFFNKIEPFLKKFGTVTYSLNEKSYVVVSNKELVDLVADMYLDFTNRHKNIEAVKKWNEMLELLEKLTMKYACYIKITHPRCLESTVADVRLGKIESSIFEKYEI